MIRVVGRTSDGVSVGDAAVEGAGAGASEGAGANAVIKGDESVLGAEQLLWRRSMPEAHEGIVVRGDRDASLGRLREPWAAVSGALQDRRNIMV